VFSAACSLLVAAVAAAQSYPVKPVRIVVTLAPGGTADILARIVAQKLTEAWGQQIVVENRPGASGMIGAEIVAKAPPDGYTLLMGYNAEITINQSLLRKMTYDPVKDLAPVTIAGTTPMILVIHPSLPAKTIKELMALARARPGELTYGSAGNGSTPHLGGELLKHSARVDITHVPYKSAALVVPELIGGQVSMLFSGMPLAMPHVRAGKLRALAVSTGSRSPAAPDVPTVAESGFPGFDITNWFGIFVPAGTSRDIVDTLYREIARGVSAPDVKERLAKEGGAVNPIPPDEYARFIQAEIAKYAKIIREARITVD
jgi:tripartite-type tricarboxylate transporter receptor subunit TctC